MISRFIDCQKMNQQQVFFKSFLAMLGNISLSVGWSNTLVQSEILLLTI